MAHNSDGSKDVEFARARRLYQLLQVCWSEYGIQRLGGHVIKEIRVRAPRFNGDQAMVIIKTQEEDGQYVGFHTADDAAEAMRGALERLANGQLVLKPDQYGQRPPSAG